MDFSAKSGMERLFNLHLEKCFFVRTFKFLPVV
uniref:Uncharacterized protein n=1 Tax=Rhizophora mucronata TaxID=61149 RepID=A0A2P2NC86_RHIMU